MNKSMKSLLTMRGMKLIYILVVTALFGGCWLCYYMEKLGLGGMTAYAIAISLLYLCLLVPLGRIYGIFSVGTSRISQLLYAQGLSLIVTAGISYVIMTICTLRFFNPLPLLGLLAAQLLWSVLWSYCANRIYFRLNKEKETIIVYTCKEDLRKLEEIKYFNQKFRVIRYVEAPEDTEKLLEDIRDAEVVFLSGLDMDVRNLVIKFCITQDIQCYVQPKVGDILMAGAEHMQMFSVPLMRVRREYIRPEYAFAKRLLDVVASLLAIILLSPFMLVTAIAIKLQDGGPVLYKQVRLTQGGREFKVLKFRSMRVDAEKDGIARLSTENDDRITPVGKLIRAIRFDELPQLLNILKGDMTIVGPRPERPEIARQYEQEIPSFGLRLQVKAGLTGYAQIYGKYNTEPYDKLKMDLMYINNMSMAEDLRLILATIKVLFIPESTEGVAQGQTTASHKEEVKEEQSV